MDCGLFKMVAIAPFRALRYNLDIVGSLSRVVAPPYDVISPEEQDRLYEVSPYNIVRLILGKQDPTDSPSDNRYTRAKRTLDQWRGGGILIQDEVPAIYLYEHTFAWPHHLSLGPKGPYPPSAESQVVGWQAPHQLPGPRNAVRSSDHRFEHTTAESVDQQIGAGQAQSFRRLGFVALLEFEGSLPDQVLLHEATFEEPKADRTRLLEAVQANLSPLFCIFPDNSHTIADLLNRLCQETKPLATFMVPAPPEAGQDEAVRIWAMTDSHRIHQLQQQVAPVSVLVADGHHRFEAALSRRQVFGAVMSGFFWREDPAVLVRPIHRVVRLANASQEMWRSRLQSLMHLEPVPSLDRVTRWLATGEGQGRFGYYTQGRFYQASLHEDLLAQWLLHPSVPLALAGLEVTILHELLIPRLAGQNPGADERLRYTPEPSHAIAMVDNRQADCAWLLRQIPLAQIFALAAQGFTLPQKSTYFYPKVLSGLFINPFGPAPLPESVRRTEGGSPH